MWYWLDKTCAVIFNTLRAGVWYIHTSISGFRLPYQCPSSSADCARELFKGSNGSASLVDCTRKKFFGWGCRFFVTGVISEVVLGSFWLMLPGLGRKKSSTYDVTHKKPASPKQKIVFQVQTRRPAAIFETFTGSAEHTGPEKFPRKATCV